MKDPRNYMLGNQLIPEASSCKYLGIIIRSDLSWADHVSYRVKKAWETLHLIMRVLKKGNSSTKRLAYTTPVRPILEYGAVLDRVKKKPANLHIIRTNRTGKH